MIIFVLHCRITFFVSAYNISNETNASKMIESLPKAVKSIQNLYEKYSKPQI